MKLYYINPSSQVIELEHFFKLRDCFLLEVVGDWLVNYNFLNKIYCVGAEDDYYFTSSINALSKIIKLEIDEEVAFFYRNSCQIFPPYTIYRGVKRITIFSKFRFDDNQRLLIENCYPTCGQARLELERFEELLLKALPRDYNHPVLALSGGADSSLLAILTAKNGVKVTTVTCVMAGLETEAERAERIALKCEFPNIRYRPNQDELQSIIDEYLRVQMEPIGDPTLPVVTAMFRDQGYDCLLDGYGADSVLLGLPHNRLVNWYRSYFLILKPAVMLLNKWEFQKGKYLLRLLYRFKKIINSVASCDVYECFLKSLNLPTLKNSSYYQAVCADLKKIHTYLGDIQRTVAYFFLTRIVAIRGIQKFELLRNQGIEISLPFLRRELIDYISGLATAELFDRKVIKKPVYNLLDRYLPGEIPRNRTSPFYVKYTAPNNCSRKNRWGGREYPVSDSDCFNFASRVQTKLAQLI